MKVFKSAISFFRNTCLRSWFSWLFACIHVAWFFVAVASMPPPSPAYAEFLKNGGVAATLFAGRPFHFHYEPTSSQLLILGDIPTMLAGIPIDLILSPFLKLLHVSLYSGSYIGAGLLLFIGTRQWMIIGALIERWLHTKLLKKT